MARLILAHKVEQLFEQGFPGRLVHPGEEAHRQPFQHDLEPEVLEVPARLVQDRFKNAPGGVGEGILVLQLLVQLVIKDFGMARLIHHLCGAIELRINPRHCRGELTSHEDR